jgi:hypothetical protein
MHPLSSKQTNVRNAPLDLRNAPNTVPKEFTIKHKIRAAQKENLAAVKTKLNECYDPLPLEYRQMIREAVQDALKPHDLLHQIEDEYRACAVEDLRRRLRAFPDVCLQAQEAEGTEAVLLNFEIREIKDALKYIANDPLYQIIPMVYFRGFDYRHVSYELNCSIYRAKRNERQLFDKMLFWIYGIFTSSK